MRSLQQLPANVKSCTVHSEGRELLPLSEHRQLLGKMWLQQKLKLCRENIEGGDWDKVEKDQNSELVKNDSVKAAISSHGRKGMMVQWEL